MPEAEDDALSELDEQRLPLHRRVWDLLVTIIAGRIAGKIIAPYLFILFILAMLAIYVVTRLVSQSLSDQFTAKLLDRGRATNELVVQIEREQLQTLRLMANTEGVPEALQARSATQLQPLLTPLQQNGNLDLVDVVAADGAPVFILRHDELSSRGQLVDAQVGQTPLAQKVLAGQSDALGDKYAEIVQTSWGKAVYTAAPVKLGDQIVGVVLVGAPLDRLLERVAKEALVSLTLYENDGKVNVSTLPLLEAQALAAAGGAPAPVLDITPEMVQQTVSTQPVLVSRQLSLSGRTYQELIGALVVRGQPAAPLGIAVRITAIQNAQFASRAQLTQLFGLIVLGVLALGLWLARLITKPLSVLVNANEKVSRGDLTQSVPVMTKDETGVLSESFNRMVEGLRDREKVKNMFSQYVTAQVSDAVLRGDVKLGGDRIEVTILLTHIRSFATLMEGLDPEQLVLTLNRYFEHMIDAIIEFDGILDKFIFGDGILIEYNAPIPQERHPLRAVLTALRMRERLARFNADRVAAGEPTLKIGAGINVGPAVVGNIGAEGKKVEYTALGDTVNVAARLESATKEVGTDIILSAATYEFVKDFVDVAEAMPLSLKGKTEPVYAHVVIGLKPGLDLGQELITMPLDEVRTRAAAANRRTAAAELVGATA